MPIVASVFLFYIFPQTFLLILCNNYTTLKKYPFLFLSIILFAMNSCTNKSATTLPSVINHSFSNYTEVTLQHLDWNANINFNSKTIEATATWHFTNKAKSNQLILDTKTMKVSKVLVSGKEVAFVLDSIDHDYLGSALTIPITATDSVVSITYTTSPNAKALQWLTAQQTADKKLPYLFN